MLTNACYAKYIGKERSYAKGISEVESALLLRGGGGGGFFDRDGGGGGAIFLDALIAESWRE